MALTSSEEQMIIHMLRQQDRSRVESILLSAQSLLQWLADAVGLAADLYRRIRTAARDFWQGLRDFFL